MLLRSAAGKVLAPEGTTGSCSSDPGWNDTHGLLAPGQDSRGVARTRIPHLTLPGTALRVERWIDPVNFLFSSSARHLLDQQSGGRRSSDGEPDAIAVERVCHFLKSFFFEPSSGLGQPFGDYW